MRILGLTFEHAVAATVLGRRLSNADARTSRILVAILFLLPAALHAQSGAIPSSAAQVPAEYRAMYDELDAQLAALDSAVSARRAGATHPVTWATELLVANSNRGEALLAPQTMTGVTLTLDRLKDMGFRGISIAVDYPILVPEFPRAAEYLDFYRRVAQEVRSRGMSLHIGAQTIFPNPAFSSLPVDYSGLTIEKYTRDKIRMVRDIIGSIGPDYLTIENEPQTMQMNTGLPFTVETVLGIVHTITDSVQRGNVKLGAGAGTWDDPVFCRRLAQETSLDYIDLHVYPIQREFVLERVADIAALVARANKRLVLGESWLYKVRDSELGGPAATAADVFARDIFSFWSPLDIRFAELIHGLAHLTRMDFASLFWMRFFYGYVEYDTRTRALPPAAAFRTADSVAARNIVLNALSPTGTAVRAMLLRTDATPPPAPGGSGFRIESVRPSGSRGAAILRFTAPRACEATVRVYDALGRLVFARSVGVPSQGQHEVSITRGTVSRLMLYVTLESAGLGSATILLPPL